MTQYFNLREAPPTVMRQAFQATGNCISIKTKTKNGRTYGFLSIDGSDVEIIYFAYSDAPPALQPGERVIFTVEPHTRQGVWEGKYRARFVQRLGSVPAQPLPADARPHDRAAADATAADARPHDRAAAEAPPTVMRHPFRAIGSCVNVRTHPDNGKTYGFLSIDGSDEQVYFAQDDAPPQLQSGERVVFTVRPHLRGNAWEGKYQAVQVQRMRAPAVEIQQLPDAFSAVGRCSEIGQVRRTGERRLFGFLSVDGSDGCKAHLDLDEFPPELQEGDRVAFVAEPRVCRRAGGRRKGYWDGQFYAVNVKRLPPALPDTERWRRPIPPERTDPLPPELASWARASDAPADGSRRRRPRTGRGDAGLGRPSPGAAPA